MSVQQIALDAFQQLVGQKVGVSRWFVLDQQRIDDFAKVTEDEQAIHVDAIAAAQTLFGGTIAHGFLSLSMLSAMAASALPQIAGVEMTVNYGIDGLRFLMPVPSGARVRSVFTLKSFEERIPGQWRSSYDVSMEIEGEEKPALVAEWLFLNVMPPQQMGM